MPNEVIIVVIISGVVILTIIGIAVWLQKVDEV